MEHTKESKKKYRPQTRERGVAQGSGHGHKANSGVAQGSGHGQTANNTRADSVRDSIVEHIHSHRVTLLQGETGSGKSTAVPQFLLDDATAREQHDSVRVIVAQPRRIAAVSLARYVASSRGERVGGDVGFAVGHDSANQSPRTRLTYVTTGYLLEWLGHMKDSQKSITHIFVDEVHVRSVEQDLLLLLLKLCMFGKGRNKSLQYAKLIIMSATMEVRPLQEYFRYLLRTEEDQNLDPISIAGHRFPVKIVHIDEMLEYLPSLPKPVADVGMRLVELSRSSTGERALDGTSFPKFAVNVVIGLVRHIAEAGDSILVFVAGLLDIFELQRGFERSAKDDAVPLDVVFIHSILDKEEQDAAISPPRDGTAKVVLATNIAESSLTIPNVRVVIDLGHEMQNKHDNLNDCSTLSRIWCSKASAKQRAGRVGRISPGIVYRLFSRETFGKFADHDKPDIALKNLGTTILQVKRLFQSFPEFSVVECLKQLLDSPPPGDVVAALESLQTLGAIAVGKTSSEFELTILGRLATDLSPDVSLARFVFLGLLMGCGIDCVVMAAGISLGEDIFHQPLLKQGSMDHEIFQERRLSNVKARMRFDGGYYSDLLVYRQVFLEWVQARSRGASFYYSWLKESDLQPARLNIFLLIARTFARSTIGFLVRELSSHRSRPGEKDNLATRNQNPHYHMLRTEIDNLSKLATLDTGYFSALNRALHSAIFCKTIATLQIVIAAAFARNLLVSSSPAKVAADYEIRELEGANMPAHLSFKMEDVPPNLVHDDIPKLEKTLKILGPFIKLLPLGQKAVVVQCELHQERSPGIIVDLPILARTARLLASADSRNGPLVIYSKANAQAARLEEIYVGRLSMSRSMKWTTVIGEETRMVRFSGLSLVSKAVETRKDYPSHLAVAVNLQCSSTVLASQVTVLPPFAIPALLVFRPSGLNEELHIRVHAESGRIFSLRYGFTVLELAPRFIHIATLDHVERLRSDILKFIGGRHLGNLGIDMMLFHQSIISTDLGPTGLAWQIGPWLKYPSLSPVKNNFKDCKPRRRYEDQKWKSSTKQSPVSPGTPQDSSLVDVEPKRKSKFTEMRHPPKIWQPSLGSPRTSQDSISSPLMVQSKDDLHRDVYDNFRGSTSSRLEHADDSFERVLKALAPEVDRKHLLEWINGDKTRNVVYFQVLQKLVNESGDTKELKALLEYVHTKREDLFYKKQKPEVEGWYHSFCNPDASVSASIVRASFGTEGGQSIEFRTLASGTKDDHVITKKVELADSQRQRLIHALPYQQFVAKIWIGSKSATVSGKAKDVVLALEWVENVRNVQEMQHWAFDGTYFDSNDMRQNVRCEEIHDWDNCSRAPLPGSVMEFSISRDNGRKLPTSSHIGSATATLFHSQMKDVFDKTLENLNPVRRVEIQARLGRVSFTSSRLVGKNLPFIDGQVQPLSKLRPYIDNHRIRKRRFVDSISEKDFFHLRACFHLCYPKKIERQQNFIIVVSTKGAKNERPLEEKLRIVEAPVAPGKFHLEGVEKKRRLAAIDIVRLHTGSITADVRVSMQAKDVHEPSREAFDFVSKITRRGSKLEFPTGPYVVELERHKESECFLYEGVKVSLTLVKQTRGAISRDKYEVEFEATSLESCSPDGLLTEEITVPLHELTSKIPLVLDQVQSVCSLMSLKGPSSATAGVAFALLRSWTIDHDVCQIKDLLEAELFPALDECPTAELFNGDSFPVNSKHHVVHVDEDDISSRICSLVEMFCHYDGRVIKEKMNIGVELQLALLRALRSLKISLSKSVEWRVKSFLNEYRLEPENALEYACLLRCHCSSFDWTWNAVLQPYVMQLILEQRADYLKEFSFHLNLLDISLAPIEDALMRTSIWTSFSALARVFQEENTSRFLKLFNLIVTDGEAMTPPTNLVRHFVRDLLGYHTSKAASFVCRCLEWIVDNGVETYMHSVLWLLEVLKSVHILVDENCRAKVVALLSRLPLSTEGKRELEESLVDIYGVDETQFRNLHYQRILQELGPLQDSHIKELRRRGLTEVQFSNFNFQSWIPGKKVLSSGLIPGVNERGDRLVGSSGIFIPARDPSGQIIGGQIKVDKNRTGKYVWLSSNNLFVGGKGPRMGGELPLFCCVPEEIDTFVVGLCEGGLKAHVLAALSGLPVIGASGADFSQSKGLLEGYLAMMDVRQIVFFPDAGSQCNDQVSRNYFRTFRLLRDWGYKILVAWWGQLNKAEYDDIDDYLAKNPGVTDVTLLSTYQFWQLLHPDVQEVLLNFFPEYRKKDVPSDPAPDEKWFTDDDGIRIRVGADEEEVGPRFYQITIPKAMMVRMPPAPDDYVTPQSVPNFTIEVRMVDMRDLDRVGEAMDWLLCANQREKILGLDCEHGLDGELRLLQLSTHQRCVLIRLTERRCSHPQTLADILKNKKIVKSGAEVQNDGLAIYHTTGLMVNGLKNISHAFRIENRTKGMLEIFRTLYGWEWMKKKDITRSDWACPTLSLEQIKYAALDAWVSRMIALEGKEATREVPVTSLDKLPPQVLDLFARAITSANLLQRTAKTVFETSGTITEGSRRTLRLLQHSFRARVMGKSSQVELRFNDGQQPVHFNAMSRTGKSVILSSASKPCSAERPLAININSISTIIVDNSNHQNWQDANLRDAFYTLLCHPEKCPRHLLRALRCEPATSEKQAKTALPVAPMQLMLRCFESVSRSLNKGQREAFNQILISPLSATIGPPGTGKTRLITAIGRTWLDVRGEKETLLCTAYQNVAARNLAENLAEENVQGVLLLVSEDYFVDWHESLYEKLAKFVVITKRRCEIPGAVEDWRTRNKSSTVPILVCTLALVGCPAFESCLAGAKVTAMVIDECSQAAEGCCVHPLMCLPDLALLTVLGDPHQLPPYGSGSACAELPSIFDLVSNGCEVKILTEQYRMPAMVCAFLSGEIYQHRLWTAPSRLSDRHHDATEPLMWVDVRGSATNDPGNPSKYNLAEAQAILQCCKIIAELSCEKQVTVLTLYEEQNRRLCQLLAAENMPGKVNIHNVDSFQGQQNDIVLISLVAGKRFSSFAADRHRACVMLSRVRRFLCVFGNHYQVKLNPQAEMWRSLADFCDARGLVISQKDAGSLLSANLGKVAKR